RHADDLEPRLRHLGRQHRVRERASQALPQHDLGFGADQGRQAFGRGPLRRVLRSSARDGRRRVNAHLTAPATTAMPKKTPEELLASASEWWDTSIIE